jgi:hypothetical protein
VPAFVWAAAAAPQGIAGARECEVVRVEVAGVEFAHLGSVDRRDTGNRLPRRERRRVIDVELTLDLDRAAGARAGRLLSRRTDRSRRWPR